MTVPQHDNQTAEVLLAEVSLGAPPSIDVPEGESGNEVENEGSHSRSVQHQKDCHAWS